MKFLIVLLLVLVVATVGTTYKRWEGQAPQVMFNRDFKIMGRSPDLRLTVLDPGTGLRHIAVHLKQKDQDIVLADDVLDKDKSKTYDLGKLITEKYKMQEGPASVSVSASDYALRNFGHGNETDVTKDFTVHLYPPKLEVLEGQHYINQGGSECVVYR